MTVRSGNWKQSLLAGAALLGLATSAQAADIDTIPAWNGVSFISSWGTPNTATYGQTITPDATQRRLTSMSFELFQGGGAPPQYQAFVYQWDPATQHIVGASLFTSGIFTAPSGSFFTKVTINTGSVVLTPG